jgi:hypothetical protein
MGAMKAMKAMKAQKPKKCQETGVFSKYWSTKFVGIWKTWKLKKIIHKGNVVQELWEWKWAPGAMKTMKAMKATK